ncbi:MAG: LPS translocon maturation chaperone LptM [Hydrogenophaga sp.]|uniref:LPS translocon maturation chaperone LptM n=1 Tax=Hydrogenophaga sp. TaxID=1904254 RepID=UPI001D696A3A|nr:lipoprotein [Hydrogenophaga sp.]MBW0185482.1 lipoprotein [Hydrogenophaga sp.]
MFGLKRILGRALRPSRGKAIAASALCALMLTACGQRGPLYLPAPDHAPAKKPSSTTPYEAPTAPVAR